MSISYFAKDTRHIGPSRSWTDLPQPEAVIPPLSTEIVKKATISIASLSVDSEECAQILDMLGIDIEEVWS